MENTIQIQHDGQKVEANRELDWIAQRVYKNRVGTIYWKWIWISSKFKHWNTYTKKKRMNNKAWGFWAPVVIWKGKRNKKGYNCLIRNPRLLNFL